MTLRFLLVVSTLTVLPMLAAQDLTTPSDLEARVGKNWVEIYGDFTEVPKNFGHSSYRSLIHDVSLELMQQTNSLWLANKQGWLTAVVVARRLAEQLQKGELAANQYIIDLGGIYRLQYRNVDIQFSLEPAPLAMLDLIRQVYRQKPEDMAIVVDHYRRNYVVRIYRAENVFNSKQQDVDFAEALVAATLIGDSYQILWGIHDGYNLLDKIKS